MQVALMSASLANRPKTIANTRVLQICHGVAYFAAEFVVPVCFKSRNYDAAVKGWLH